MSKEQVSRDQKMCDSIQEMNLCALVCSAEGKGTSNLISENEERKTNSIDKWKYTNDIAFDQSIFKGDEENHRIDFNSCTSTQENTLKAGKEKDSFSNTSLHVTMNYETNRPDHDERREHVSNHRDYDSTVTRQRELHSPARDQEQVAATKIINQAEHIMEVSEQKNLHNKEENDKKTLSTPVKSGRNYRSPKLSRFAKKLFSLRRTPSSTEENMMNWRKENVPFISQMNTMYIDDSVLVEFCGRGFYSPSDVRIALENDPSMAQIVSPDGRNALHAVCVKGLPIRKSTVVTLQDYSFNFESMKTVIHCHDQQSHDNKKESTFLQKRENSQNPFEFSPYETEYVAKTPFRILKEDARNFKDVLKMLVESNPMGATKLDKNGDLPVHLLARQLWHWKNKMKPRKKRSQKERIIFGEVLMIIRDCIEILLKPLAHHKKSCYAIGSKGILLPLHIGAIHNVSYAIFEGLLSRCKDTAAIATIGALEGLENRLPFDLFESKLLIKFETNKQRRENIQQTSDFILACNSNNLSLRWDTNTNRPERLVDDVI